MCCMLKIVHYVKSNSSICAVSFPGVLENNQRGGLAGELPGAHGLPLLCLIESNYGMGLKLQVCDVLSARVGR